MSLLSAKMFSPEMDGDHPVTVIPALDVADNNPLAASAAKPLDPLRTNEFRGDESRVGVSTWNATDAYDISWPSQRGAKFYRLYGSVSPANSSNLLQDEITDTTYRFDVPFFTEIIVYYFWIAAVDASGTETYITQIPASLMSTGEKTAFSNSPFAKDGLFPGMDLLNAELGKAIEFIRSSNRVQLAVAAETFRLHLRRHASDKPWGMRCSCCSKRTDGDSDSDFDAVERCKFCFGTGISGGYLPAIKIMCRYGNAPIQKYQRTKGGFNIVQNFDTWTLATPVVRTGDLVIRESNGQRFVVGETKPDISARGVRLHQEFNLTQIEKTSMLYEVTDASVKIGIEKSGMPSYLVAGYRIFN